MMSAAEQIHGEPSTTAIKTFDFHGDSLHVVPLPDGDVGVSLRRLCEAVPVDFNGQRQRLARAAAKGARWAVVCKITATGLDGKNYTMLVLPRRSIPMWAATVELGMVDETARPGIVEKLARYQDECADVLADHFLRRDKTARSLRYLRRMMKGVLGAVESLAETVKQHGVLLAHLMASHPANATAADGPVVGEPWARAHVLGPLREIARMRAAALRRDDAKTIAACRFEADRELRRGIHYPASGKQAWAFMPSSKSGPALGELARMRHEAAKNLARAGIVSVPVIVDVSGGRVAQTKGGAFVAASGAMGQEPLPFEKPN